MRRWRGRAAALSLAGALVVASAAACGGSSSSGGDGSSTSTPNGSGSTDPADPDGSGGAVADPEHAVDPPGAFKPPAVPADLLIWSQKPLADDVVDELKDIGRIDASVQFSLALVPMENRALAVAAVEPKSFRNFNPDGTAQSQETWNRVAGGELTIGPKLAKRFRLKGDFIRLGAERDAPKVHIGSYAEQINRIDLVVNEKWGETLEMPEGNAMLISTGLSSPQSVQKRIQKIVGDDTSVQILGPDLDVTVQQQAVVTGGSVARIIGVFSYRVIGGGRIAPDPAWVQANIRTEEVPILGSVTCHKAMIPQLRAALQEIRDTPGLESKINPDEYAGCYYPRFIAGSTSLSNHSFGTAVDLNVPGNQRGTSGEMDRTVVSIFKKWGFAWGGDWNYTDPMHFEMNRVVKVG